MENEPIKRGFLKHNLYEDPRTCSLDRKYVTEEQRADRREYVLNCCSNDSESIALVLNCFPLKVRSQFPFVCYEFDGEERWFQEGGGDLENMSSEWAMQNLEDIGKL